MTDDTNGPTSLARCGGVASVEINTWEAGMRFDSSPQEPHQRSGGLSESAGADELLGRSCMKWGDDGELSAFDLQGILARLSAVDQQASSLMDCPLDS